MKHLDVTIVARFQFLLELFNCRGVLAKQFFTAKEVAALLVILVTFNAIDNKESKHLIFQETSVVIMKQMPSPLLWTMVTSHVLWKLFSLQKLHLNVPCDYKDYCHFFSRGKFLGQNTHAIEQIKEKLECGDDCYIQMLHYYSHNIKGSDNYWRSKTQELEGWIQHHVSRGRGPPTFFITFSCA